MIWHTTRKARWYLRRDPDAGWVLAFWRIRISFSVRAGKQEG